MRFLPIVLALTLIAPSLAGEDTAAAKAFESLTLTRSWALGMWRVNNCKEHDEQSENFRLSMTAQAFRYWLLVQKGLREADPAHESQIRKTFASGELSEATLKNPLFKNSEYKGGFAVGRVGISAEEYAAYSVEFERFVKSEADLQEPKKENKPDMATPNHLSD